MYKYTFFLLISYFLFSCSLQKKNFSHVSANLDSVAFSRDDDSIKVLGKDFLIQNSYGSWELYVGGDPATLGRQIGFLSSSLYNEQERIFGEQLSSFLPTERKRRWMMRFIRWYNRKLERYIDYEYLEEIYALSTFSKQNLGHLGSPYQRALWMHGAHDIGHALQDLAMVGCSSFAVWGEHSADGNLLIARNLDFYFGDDFAKRKMIYFVQPEKGIPFMSVSWPGMVGVLSGMNLHGLTISLNAGKSSIPFSAKTPISIVAREILQYASTIDEAIAIAKTKKVFVSESLLIGSASDRRAIIIELSPQKMDVVEATSGKLICTNHFQSDKYKKDRRNIKHMLESHSLYRYQKLEELLDAKDTINVIDAVHILRDREGVAGVSLGMGNDKSLNHLLAHHGIIFQPESLLVHVANSPGQMGDFVSYDLRQIFERRGDVPQSFAVLKTGMEADPFVETEDYRNFKRFRAQTEDYLSRLDAKEVNVDDEDLNGYVSLNPDLWLGYYIQGRIHYLHRDYSKAKVSFEKALAKELPTLRVKKDIERYLERTMRQWNKKR
ncbi:C45 family autoproteolytic acyltransferase/hydolase [Sphingobacterium sp. LRF_L2]|uniref:C45 family autoproteolytic acyltransferase/hydolase n=1 Tax=Sphingobacterium sp. LRF_L2 TaxID=3369421 RepID=UPI003F5EFEFA